MSSGISNSANAYSCTAGAYSGAAGNPPVIPATSIDPSTVSGIATTLATMPNSSLEFARYDLASGMSYSYGFSAFDYDCDGRLDVSYFDSFASWRALLRKNDGAIGYITWHDGVRETIVSNETFDFTPPPNPSPYLFERHVAADIDGDSYPDIVGVANSHSAVVAYVNPRAYNAEWYRRVLSTHTPGAVNLAVADIDGDGDVDVFVAMRANSNSILPGRSGIAWLENTGGLVAAWAYHPIEVSDAFADPRTVQAADIDGDGVVDVVVSDATTGMLAWYSRTFPDTWVRHKIDVLNTAGAHYGQVVDMDKDGRPDILIPHSRGISWLKNVDGGNTWERYPIVSFDDADWANLITEVAAGDLDGDGVTDVAFTVGSLVGNVTGRRTGGLFWARRDGYSWQISNIYSTDNNCVGLQLADFDGDGDLDIISNTEYQQNAVTLWINRLIP